MAELTEVIKTSKPVKTDLEDIKEKYEHSSLDSVIRNTLEKNKRLEFENKILKQDLQKCRKENRELKAGLKGLNDGMQED